MGHKEKILTLFGIFFLILGIASIIINISAGTPRNLIWLCDHMSLIIGLAFLFRSSFWITAEISLGLIPQLLWNLDFFSKLFFDKFIFGFTDYMFLPYSSKALHILGWNHVFMLPIAVIGLYFIGMPRKDAWRGALIHGIFLIIFSYLFYNGLNLNCVQESCLFFLPGNLAYQIYWPILFFLVVVIPTNYLLVWAYKKFQHK